MAEVLTLATLAADSDRFQMIDVRDSDDSPRLTSRAPCIVVQVQAEARVAGLRFAAAEQATEAAFPEGDGDPSSLRTMTDAAAKARAEVRFIHLSRHLKTPLLLTDDQVTRYNVLLG